MTLDEFFVLFTAQTAPFLEGMASMTVAAERMAVAVETSSVGVVASNDRMMLAARGTAVSLDTMAIQGQVAYERLALASWTTSNAMAAASARAAAATAGITTAVVGAEAAATKAAMATAKRYAMGAFGAALIAGATVKMAGDFEIATARLVSSAGETEEGLAIVRDGIKKMAGEVGNTTGELAKAMYTISSGGQRGADGLLVLRAAAEGAAAEGADLGEVADAITSILADYHLKADQSALVTSKLVAAVGSGKTTFQEFTSSLSAILPIASAAHISLDDISAAIASMTVHGMSARQASQNLADVVRHMVAPTQVQTKELGQLGISSSDLADKLGKQGLTGTLQEISTLIISKMGPSGKVLLNALNQSKEAANSANVMIGAMPKNLQALTTSYKNGDTTLGEWRKTLKALPPEQANLLAQWASLQNRATGFNDILKSGSPAAQTYMDALRRATGDATGLNVALMLTGENTEYVNETVKKVGGAHTEAGNHVMHWSEIQETFNNKMHRAKAGLGSLAVQIGEKLLPAVSEVVGWIAKAAEWLSKHPKLATALAVALGILTVGLLAAAIAMWVMNIAMLANPTTWIIVGIVAAIVFLIVVIYFLVKHWDSIWGAIKKGALAVWHFLVMCWDGIVAAFWWCVHAVRDAAVWVWHLLVDTWNKIADAAKSFWNDWIVKPIKKAWDKAKEWCGDAVDFLKALPGKIAAGLKALPGKLKDAAEEGAHKFFYAIGYGIGKAYVFFRDLPKNVWHFIVSMWDGAVRLSKQGVNWVVNTFFSLRKKAIDTVVGWWHSTTTAIKNGWNGAIKWCRDSYHKVVDTVEEMRDDAIAAVVKWWHETTTSIKNGWDAAIKWCREAPGKVHAEFERLRKGAIDKITELVDKTVKFLSELPEKAGKAITELPGKIWDKVKDAGTWLYDAGRNIVSGAINGFRDRAKEMLDMVRGWGHDILSGFNDAVGNKSPSWKFAQAGANVVLGFVRGIKANARLASDAVRQMGEALLFDQAVSVSMGVTAAGSATPLGAGGWRPPVQPSAADRDRAPFVAELHLDGKQVYAAIVPHAQTHKDRNGTTQLD